MLRAEGDFKPPGWYRRQLPVPRLVGTLLSAVGQLARSHDNSADHRCPWPVFAAMSRRLLQLLLFDKVAECSYLSDQERRRLSRSERRSKCVVRCFLSVSCNCQALSRLPAARAIFACRLQKQDEPGPEPVAFNSSMPTRIASIPAPSPDSMLSAYACLTSNQPVLN